MARYYASTNNANWGIFYDVTEGSYSIENNTSPVGVNVYLYRTSSSSYYGGTANISFTLNGETKSTSVYPSYPTNIGVGESNAHYMASFSYTVGHNADGSKTVSFSLSWSANFSPSSASGSGSITLSTIPRASEISSVSTANIGSNATINVNRKSNSFTHTITYTFGDLSGTIVTKSSNTSISWTIPTSFYGQIPNSKTGNGTLTITTYNGNTQIGSSSTKSFSVTTSESACKPTVTGSVIDSNSTTTTITGNNKILIAGYSTASVSCSSSPKNSSSIKTISVNSKYAYTGTSYTEVSRTKELENFNSNTIVIKAKDSRGYENTKTLNSGSDYTLINYIPLTFNGTVSRQTPTGSVLLLSFSGNYFGSNLGNTSNSLNISWKYREKGEENWVNGRTLIEGTDYTINSSNNTYSSGNSSFQSTISLGNNFDYQKAYEIAVFYNDVLVSASVVIQGLKGKPIINWGENFFNVNGEIRQNNVPISAGGGSSITTTVDVGTTTTGASGTQAKVTNSGNSVNAVFDFVIPKGDKGEPGNSFITELTSNIYFVDGTTPTLDEGYYYTGNYHFYFNGNIVSYFENAIVYFDKSLSSDYYQLFVISSKGLSNSVWKTALRRFTISTQEWSGTTRKYSATNWSNIYDVPLVTSIDSNSTDSEFPSAKCVYDAILNGISVVETDPVFTASVASSITSNDISNWNNKSNFSGNYNDLTNKPTLFSGDYNDLENKPTIPVVPTNISSFTNDTGYITGLVMLEYGTSTWQEFQDAFNSNKIVYCKVNGRMAFLAYISASNVEFQYYRSLSSPTVSSQPDEVYVYALTSANKWTTTTRKASSTIDVGTGLSRSYTKSSRTMTLSVDTSTIATKKYVDDTLGDIETLLGGI